MENYKGTKVHLTEYEVWMVRVHARCAVRAGRQVGGSAHNYTNGKRKRSDQQVMNDGVGGEWSYDKMFDLFPRIVFKPGGYIDAIHKGWTVDVKTSDFGEYSLLYVKDMPHIHTDPVDWYALMIGHLPDYYFGGWIRSKDLLVPAHFRKKGDKLSPHYDVYTAWQHELVGFLPERELEPVR